MTEKKTERLEMRVSEEFLRSVDDWRRNHPDIPPRAEAVRELIQLGLKGTQYKNAAMRLMRIVEAAKVVGVQRDDDLAALNDLREFLGNPPSEWPPYEDGFPESITLLKPHIHAEVDGKHFQPARRDNVYTVHMNEVEKTVSLANLEDIPYYLARGAWLMMEEEEKPAPLVFVDPDEIKVTWYADDE